MFHVGQMVVCIHEWSAETKEMCSVVPQRGHIYTIRGIEPSDEPGDTEVFLLLEEVVNPVEHYDDIGLAEPSFGATRFRPVKTTSIEVFRKIVAPIFDKDKVA